MYFNATPDWSGIFIKIMIKDNSLYLVTSQEYNLEKDTFDIASQAIEGGIDILQMREKSMNSKELLALGKKLCDLCKKNGVVFIVNDDPNVAKEIDADGVHLGQEDLKKYSVENVREILGNKIIGLSTHSVEQFEEANKSNCDYVAFGPIFSTKTKNYFIGMDDVSEVLSIAKKPVVFIGGINLKNIDSLLELGVKNIAVIRAIVQAEDIVSQVKLIKEKMLECS